MKTLFLVGGSRAGIDLFQSLLDGHPQIMQFPGIIHTTDKLITILSHDDSRNLAQNFVDDYPHFFDSRVNKLERHDMLGKKFNQFYLVNEINFIKNFIKIFKQKSKQSLKKIFFEKLLALHQAYALTNGQNIKHKKIMVINCHRISYMKYISKKLGNIDYEIIHTIRNPISSISSATKNWLKHNKGSSFFAKDIFYELDLITNGIKNLKKITKKIFLIKLEWLHQNHQKVLDDFCAKYKLKYNKCMRKSSYFNLEWWGDAISGKKLNGINKKFKISFNKEIFYKRDIKFLESILHRLIVFYNYDFTEKKKKYYFNFLPMKCEILVWKNTFRHKKIKHILSIPFFYIKRLIFINRFSQKNVKLPYSFGRSK